VWQHQIASGKVLRVMVESTLKAASSEFIADNASNELAGADSPVAPNDAKEDGPRYRQTGFWPRMRLKFMMYGFFTLLIMSWFWNQPQWANYAFWPGLVCTVSGLGLRLWAAGWLHKHEALATDGPYAWVRHPLYAGTGLLALGQGLMSGVPLAAIGFPLLWFILHWPAIREEETFLISIYGDAYRDFQRRVPALVPKISRKSTCRGAQCSFSWSQAWRNREYEALIVNSVAIVFYGCLMFLR
jgi:protein-S-isoprenylcysteine O-methyltransferase Ste14